MRPVSRPRRSASPGTTEARHPEGEPGLGRSRAAGRSPRTHGQVAGAPVTDHEGRCAGHRPRPPPGMRSDQQVLTEPLALGAAGQDRENRRPHRDGPQVEQVRLGQPLLDGEPVGQPVDFGARGMDPVWLPLDIHLLKAGKHTVGFAGSGESSKFKRALAPAEGGIAVVGFQLMRLDTLDGYQQALKLELEKRAAKGK